MSLQRVGQRNQNQDHHRKQRRLQKEKRVQEKNVVQLVKRKASDEKRHRESHNNPLFICNDLPITTEDLAFLNNVLGALKLNLMGQEALLALSGSGSR
jgi:hypothetical protein